MSSPGRLREGSAPCASALMGPREWSNYAVRVTNNVTEKHHIYWGGPGQDWIAQFVGDLNAGMYGRFAVGKPSTLPKPWRSTGRSF